MRESRQASPPKRVRLDTLLVERGMAESRAVAQRLILAGEVRIEGQTALKAAQLVDPDAALAVNSGPRYVSRGGDKLEAALAAFGLDVSGAVCADVGASTGGFTDCLLQHGARRVYAIDVGQGILHWRLRQDPRVVVLESTNARYLEALAEPVDWVTIDASFISLRRILPSAVRWLAPSGAVLALIKPQFEAGRRWVGKGGVVRDPEVHRRVLEDILGSLGTVDLIPLGLIRSPLLGPKGNVEFLLWAGKGPATAAPEALIGGVLSASA